MSAYTKEPGGSLIQFSKPAPIARQGEAPVPTESTASEYEFDAAMAQLEGPIRMMRSLREKIGVLERRREELETIVVRERAAFRDQIGRAKKVISETNGALTRTKEDAHRIAEAGEAARSQLQQSASRLESATGEIARLKQELESANARMNQTVAGFRARYAQDTGKLQHSIEQIKGRYAVELASFKQACTDLRTRAMSAEAAFKQLQAREGALQVEATAALNKLKQREHQIKKMALSSHLWAGELERLRRENEDLGNKTKAIATLEKEREHWRLVAEGEREQRRLVADSQRDAQAVHTAEIAKLEAERTAEIAKLGSMHVSEVAKLESAHTSELAQLGATSATEIVKLEAELRAARDELERMRDVEQKSRDELERAKMGEDQVRKDLAQARADLESSSEQVRKLRFEGPIRELLMAKERELGRMLEVARGVDPEDPARARADQVVGLLGRQVEVLREALAGNVPEPRKVTPPPFPPALLRAKEIQPPLIPVNYAPPFIFDPSAE